MAVDDVVLYMPAYDIAPQTRMRTLRHNGCGGHLMGIFNVFRRLMGKSHEEAVSTIPRTLLTRVVRGEEDDIEPSVKEFFNKFLLKTKGDVNSEKIFEDLLKAYNKVARDFRILHEKPTVKSTGAEKLRIETCTG